ncbi:MAG: hypothetical protein HYU56_00530 [Candidatus Aenigmarchaeota archaeon]|nr:hypothetical protein [Candidatus Aenigmarchaeota archaeon]
MNAITGASGLNLTASTNITLTTTMSGNATSHGTLTVTGTSRSPATIVVDTANLAILQLNFSATGEGFNISLINVTINGTATEANLTNVRLFNDTNGNGAFDAAADTQIGPALNTTTAAAKFVITNFQYNISTSGINTLFVVVNTSGASGTGGTRFSLSLNKTGDIQLVGAESSRNLTADANVTLTTPESVTTTIHGKVTFTGSNVINSAVSISADGISVIRFNITPLGEGVNITVLNVTRGGNASDGHIFNVSLYNDTDLSGTFNAGDGALGTVGLNTTTSSQYVFSGLSFNVPVAGKSLFLVVTTNNTNDVTFNLALNGTGAANLIGTTTGENLTGSSNITLTSTGSNTAETVSLSITGSSLAPATRVINTANVSVMLLNLTAGGEGMNVSVIKITRNESATDNDISNVRLFNDTDLSGTFNAGDTQIGPAVNTTSAGQYEFAGLTYNIPQGSRKSLIVVTNTSSAAATGGKTFRFNVNTTSDVNTITETTANNVTETLTTPVSNRILIYGTVTLTGKVLNADFVEINTGGFSVLQLNITATSEGANVTVLNITRTGTDYSTTLI